MVTYSLLEEDTSSTTSTCILSDTPFNSDAGSSLLNHHIGDVWSPVRPPTNVETTTTTTRDNASILDTVSSSSSSPASSPTRYSGPPVVNENDRRQVNVNRGSSSSSPRSDNNNDNNSNSNSNSGTYSLTESSIDFDDDSSFEYDSFMKEIQREVWAKVKQKKRNKRNKRRNEIQQTLSYDHSDAEHEQETTISANKQDDHILKQEEGLLRYNNGPANGNNNGNNHHHPIICTSSSRGILGDPPAIHSNSKLHQYYSSLQQGLANLQNVINNSTTPPPPPAAAAAAATTTTTTTTAINEEDDKTIGKITMPPIETALPYATMSTTKSTTDASTADTVSTSTMNNEREMIWGDNSDDNDINDDGDDDDEIGSLTLQQEGLVLDEPSNFDPFGDNEQANPIIPPASSSIDAVRHFPIETDEIDSVFDSILSIDLGEEKDGSIKTPTSSEENSSLATNTVLTSAAAINSVPRKSAAEPMTKARPSQQLQQSNGFATSSEPFLSAKVFGSREDTLLSVPFFLIEKRENEMFKVAFKQGIRPDQWNGSLLCKKFKSLYDPQDPGSAAVVVELHPETESAAEHYSQSFHWQSWINECIASFYKTGNMRIPDFCIGSDILVALQYFGILYTPDQLLFDSFATYLRVKHWSEYFTNRHTIANWVLERLNQSSSDNDAAGQDDTEVFVTCPGPSREGYSFHIGTKNAQVFDGGMFLDTKRYGKTQSNQVVYGFFNESEDGIDESFNVDVLMREDFCSFFRQFVPGTEASFSKKLAIIGYPDGTREQLELATLFIHLENSEPGKKIEVVKHSRKSQSNSNQLEEEVESGILYQSDSSNSSRSAASSPFELQKTPPGILRTCQTASISPTPDTSVLKTCQLIHTPELAECNPQQDRALLDLPPPQKESIQWMPVTSPECASTSSYLDYKNSNIPVLWMSGKGSSDGGNGIGLVGSGNMSVQHIEPLPSTEEPMSTVRPRGRSISPQPLHPFPTITEMPTSDEYSQSIPTTTDKPVSEKYSGSQQGNLMNVDHVYEDLWLQDEAFVEGWESDIPIQQHTVPSKHQQQGNDDFEVLENMQFLEMDHRISRRDIPKCLPLLDQEPLMPGVETEDHRPQPHQIPFKYNPNDFVCDVYELFEPSPWEIKRCKQQIEPMCVMQQLRSESAIPRQPRQWPPRPPRPAYQQPISKHPFNNSKEPIDDRHRKLHKHGAAANVLLDDCTETSASSSSIFEDIEPHPTIPGINRFKPR